MAHHNPNLPTGQSNEGFGLSPIFIGRQQQLDLFEIYLKRWKQLVLEFITDETPAKTAPTPENKLKGLVVLLFGRGGFGKSTLLKHYRAMAQQDEWNLATSKIVDWEFAVEGKRSLFNPPQGQLLDAAGMVAKLTQEQIAQVFARLNNKLGNKLVDYLEPSFRLGLAIGSDLRDIARNYPLLIFFDTYEEADEGDRLLRMIMGAAGMRVGWVIAGRDNLWAGSEQRERSVDVEYGYKEIVPSDRGLSINFNAGDVGAFTLSDITEYFALLRNKVPYQPLLPEVIEEQAKRILDVTQGVPLAVKIAAGLYLETANIETVTEHVDSKRTIVDQMVRRYLLHTHTNMEERARLYGLALLRRADQPTAIAAALGLTQEQARTSYRSELSQLHRSYSFIFTEKELPALHQEVRHFLRLWLQEHHKEPEIIAINERLREAHETALKHLEEQLQYSTLKERLQDDEWTGIYLDLAEQQFWLDSVEGVRYTLPFMIAGAIYRRDINEDASTIGQLFEHRIRQPYRDWWTWAIQSLTYTTSRNSSPVGLTGLQELVKLATERCPTFPRLLPDYRKELEAALWWRLGESHRGRDENKALEWYERALTRLENEAELRKAAAEAGYMLGSEIYDDKKYSESIRFLNQAVEFNPDYVWAYILRGNAYSGLKEYERAIQDYDRAIELDPTDASAYYHRGYAYLWLKNIIQARDNYTLNYKLNSTYVNAAWMVEWIGMSKQRPDMREAARLEAIETIDSEHYVAHVCRGVVLGLGGKVKEGLEEVEKAIPLDPQGWDAYFWKGMLLAYYRGQSHAEEAVTMIKQSLEVGLPHILLTPLYWLEKDRPILFVNYARPLLLQYNI